MAAVLDMNKPFIIKFWLAAFVVAGESGFSKNKVQLGKDCLVGFQSFGIRSRLIAQIRKNCFDFLFFSWISSSRSSLFSLIMAMGSIKRVEPVEDWS